MALFRRKLVKPGHGNKPAAVVEKTGPPPGPDVPDWVTDADRVRPLLRVQLVRPDRMPVGPAPVSKPLLSGDLIALAEVRDMMRVMPEHLVWWGMEPEELWVVAAHNMRVHQPPVQRDGERHLMQGDAYTAAHLCRLHEITNMPPDGLLVWIPLPHVLAFRRITDAGQLIDGINVFVQGRREMETALGGPDVAAGEWLCWDFIWCRGSLAERVIVAHEEKGPKHMGVTITGSPRFNEVWMRLTREFIAAQEGS